MATLLAIALLCGSALLANVNLRRAAAADALTLELLNAELAGETLLSTLTDAETGQRGYLLTGSPEYLVPYETATRRIAVDFARMEALPLHDPGRLRHIGHLRLLAARKLEELGATVALRRAGDGAGALALLRTDQGRRLMEAIRAEVDDVQRQVRASLDGVQAGARSPARWAFVVFMGALASALLGWAALLQRAIRQHAVAALVRLERFTQAFAATLGMVRGLDGRITFWSVGAERLYGYEPREALGRLSHELLRTEFPQPLPDIEAALARDGVWQGELTHRDRKGATHHVASQWVLHPGTAGERDAVIEINTDVTGLKRAEFARERANALLQAIVDTAPGLIYAKDREGRMLLANPPTLALIGKPWEAVAGRTDLEFLDDRQQAAGVARNDAELMRTGEAREFEEAVGSDSGQPRVWFSTKAPLRDGSGEVIGLVGISVEITERLRMERRLRVMVNELNHRVKNTLATVQAIATQTLRGADPAIYGALEGRLLALAAAHDILARESWEGADIGDVAAGQFAPYGGIDGGRMQAMGPGLRLSSSAAVALAMGLHELSSNAVRYGALSNDVGRILFQWEVVDGATQAMLRLTWREEDGPAVRQPARRGFGTRLIERSLASDMGGFVHLSFEARGVVCRIEAPLAPLLPKPDPWFILPADAAAGAS